MTIDSMVKVQLTAPDVATKILKITKYPSGRRKVQISSNLLPLFNFNKSDKVFENPRGEGLGYTVQKLNDNPVVKRVKHITSRTYKRRLANPTEITFETSAKDVLSSIPESATHVQIIIKRDQILVLPVNNIVAQRLSELLMSKKPLSVFAACSSGIDAHAAFSTGFDILSLIEMRPNEARDIKKNQDFTESGVLTAINNLSIKHVFNQDINTISTGLINKVVGNDKASVFTISLQCDAFSNASNEADKQRALDNLSSDLDMVVDAIRLITAFRWPIVALEQVPSFYSSQIGKVWRLRLRKLGYNVTEEILDSRDYEGLTCRKRLFSVGSLLPNQFKMPEKIQRRTKPIWDELEPHVLPLRNISHAKSIQDGAEVGRLRTFSRFDTWAPSLLKSQSRMAKDTCVFVDQGNYYMPNEIAEKILMGIPDNFSFDATTKTLASEQIGQGVCYKLYQHLMRSIKDHLLEFLQPHSATVIV